MSRRRTVSRARQPSAWLIVAGGLALYGALVLVLLMANVWPGPPPPWWLTRAVPVVAYGALVRLCMRRFSTPRWIIATFALWAVHLLLGALTGAAAASWAPPTDPAPTGTLALLPLLPILWVPLLLIPLRDLLTGDSRLRPRLELKNSERQAVPDRRPAAPLLGSPNVTGPAGKPTASEARSSSESAMTDAPTRRTQALEAQATEARPSPLEQGGPASARVTAAEISPSGIGVIGEPPSERSFDAVPGRETSAEVVRVSFDRVAGQLPPAAFRLPLDRMAASLLEPGYLLIPQDLVLAQLAEGLVRAGWGAVSEQFPRQLLAMADEEIARQLPDGQVVLPLEELVPQLPLELFASAAPPVDVEGIEGVPAPFQPAVPPGGVEEPAEAFTAEAPPVAEGPSTIEPSSPKTEWSLGEVEEQEPGFERDDLLALDDVEIDRELTGMAEVEIPSTVTSETDPGPSEVSVLDEPVGGALAMAERPVGEVDGPEAPVTWATEDAEIDPVMPEPVEPERAPALGAELRFQWLDEDWDERSPRQNGANGAMPTLPDARPPDTEDRWEEIAMAHSIAALLAPLKAFRVGVESVDGVKLFTVSAPGLRTGSAIAAAGLLAPLLAEGRAPWKVDQMTLRGADLALVLTPLGQGGAVLASSAPPRGTLALLEVLSLRAVASSPSDRTTVPRVGPDVCERRQGLGLFETEPPAGMAQIATTLTALGPVTAGALSNPGAERDLYLFLPSGSDLRAIGSFAGELDQAVRKAAASGQGFHTAVLRCGRRCLVIRLWRGATGSSRVVVAGGETQRPGLALRQVESAALLLGAH